MIAVTLTADRLGYNPPTPRSAQPRQRIGKPTVKSRPIYHGLFLFYPPSIEHFSRCPPSDPIVTSHSAKCMKVSSRNKHHVINIIPKVYQRLSTSVSNNLERHLFNFSKDIQGRNLSCSRNPTLPIVLRSNIQINTRRRRPSRRIRKTLRSPPAHWHPRPSS